MAKGKGKGKAEARREGGYTYSPAQKIMREDMEQGTVTLGSVFDEELGVMANSIDTAERPVGEETELSSYGEFIRSVPNLALDIIHDRDLVLSLKQWHVVQMMVQEGIRRGYQLGSDAS